MASTSMNPEPERLTVFQPKGHLAWEALHLEAREVARLPSIWWLFPGGISGFAIAVSLASQFYFHVPVPIGMWVLSVLTGPAVVLIILIATFLAYRFPRRLSLSPDGLMAGWTPLGNRFFPVVDCRVYECSGTVPLFHLSVYCKSPWSSRPRLAYCALTDDPYSAREFAAAFHQRYPPELEKKHPLPG